MEGKLCRLCCQKEATSNIFHKDSNNVDLSAKIMYCCGNIRIEDGDGLPTSICGDCERELNAFYLFVLKCETSDIQLRGQILTQVCYTPQVDVKTEKNDASDEDPCEAIPLEQPQKAEDISVEAFNSYYKVNKIRKTYQNKAKRKPTETQCAVCERQCPNLSSLVVHMRSHTNDYPYPCTLCDKKYKDNGNLKRHMEKHHCAELARPRNFTCEICGKGFYSKNDIIIHHRTHTGEHPYACDLCDARFTQVGTLLRHKKRHTGEKDHMCSICPKRFVTKVELKMHLDVHSPGKKHTCHICGASFKQHGNFRKHMKWHLKPCLFSCNYCGRNFRFKGNLALHIKKQHSETSGFCEVCSKVFPNLEVHMRRHTGERPLKCELCSSSFYDMKGYARHVSFKHTNAEKHKCEIEGCRGTYPSRAMLDFHKAKFHATHVPFPCPLCERSFYRRSDLARHMNGSSHNGNYKKNSNDALKNTDEKSRVKCT